MNDTPPRIGQTVTVYNIECRIYRIHPFGTIDVEATDGSERCWRITGLCFR